MSRPVVEVYAFEGCPNTAPTLEMIDRVASELGLEAHLRRIAVPDFASATKHRFLGPPTVRVDGLDIEPGADHRSDFTLACRLYMTADGLRGKPSETWLSTGLRASGERLHH